MGRRMTGLAPRSLGSDLGRLLREGGGLTLAGPAGLLQFGLEAVGLGLQPSVLRLQLPDEAGLLSGQCAQFVIGRRGSAHGRSFTR